MNAVWFNESGFLESQDIKPDYEIQEISAVIPIVRNII